MLNDMENGKIDLRKMNPLRAGAVGQAIFERWMNECQPWRKTVSAFASDFAIADPFGKPAVKDTFKRAFDEWKNNPVMMAEMCVTLNLAVNRYYELDDDWYEMYLSLFEKAYNWCLDNYKGDDFDKWYEIVD